MSTWHFVPIFIAFNKMAENTTYYIFQGGPENIDLFLFPERFHAQWFWTANKHVKPGDIALIYLTAPCSGIIGKVDVVGKPFMHHRRTMFVNEHMQDKWCVEVANPAYFSKPGDLAVARLSMRNLRKLFAADWGGVRYPRGNTRVPDDILPSLLELIAE